LRALPGRSVRPTADRVKEALFSMLQSRFDLDGIALLDLFAGTGALGIEGLSRGAARAVFVEQDRAARRVLAANLAACGFGSRSRIAPLPVDRALAELAARGERFHGVVMDPPYGRRLADGALAQLAASVLVAPGGWVAAEHAVDDVVAETYGCLRLTAARRYGKTAVTLFADSRIGEQVAAS
jgi:16S rRNA (guanine(966)-N(2))-methyltransferase RsmD